MKLTIRSHHQFVGLLESGLYFSSGRRELAIQIAEQFEALGSGIGVKCAVVRNA